MNIREIKITDSEAMLDLNMKLDEESDFMLFEKGERKLSVASQAEIIKGALDQKNVLWLVADSKNEDLDGYCVVSGKPQFRVKHVGSLVIGVVKKSWSKGIGFRLLESAIERSSDLGFTRLELSVRSDNQRAISLYKKAGFVIEGERKNSFNISGNYFDELYMAKV